MSSAQARPFGFERVFAPTIARRAGMTQDQSSEVRSLQAQLARCEASRDAALIEARRDGFEAGLTQARSETAAALLSAAQHVVASVEHLATEFADAEARISGAAGELALVAAEVLAARAIADTPLTAIEAAIGRVLTQAGVHEELLVHVHPSLVEPLRAMLAASAGLQARPLLLTVVADDRIKPGDVRIAWERGGLSLDAAARAAAVRAELASLLTAA